MAIVEELDNGLGDISLEYLDHALSAVKHPRKALIMDPWTMGIVSQMKGQAEMLDLGVYLFSQIGKKSKQRANLNHLHACVIIRPIQENLDKLKTELAAPQYSCYHIFFTNVVPQGMLSKLAEADQNEVIVQVKEMFFDFVPVNRDLWHLRIPDSYVMVKDRMYAGNKSQKYFDHHVQGIVSLMLANKLKPVNVRWDGSSPICREIAKKICRTMDDESQLFAWNQYSSKPILLILDRRIDPVTPLLTQWTYQSMVHELFTINNSRVDLTSTGDMGEIVLNTFDDPFYNDNIYSNFGDVAQAVKGLIEEYAHRKGQNTNVTSIQDMQNVVDNYQDYMQASNQSSKHVGLLSELSRQVNVRHLMDLSAVEQDVACTDSMSKHYSQVLDIIESPNFDDSDKLRLAIIFSLRYSKSKNSNIPLLRDALIRNARDEVARDRVKFVNLVPQVCGQTSQQMGGELAYQGHDLFRNQGVRALTSKMSSLYKGITGAENIYTQHDPFIATVIKSALKNSLDSQEYPDANGQQTDTRSPTDILIFMVGGTTYEEAAMVAELSEKTGVNIILGGSCVHNSSSFLSDVKQLSHATIQDGTFAALNVEMDGEPTLI